MLTRYTQLGEVTEETALKYLKELKDKYPEKAKITKVTVQRQDIPKKVLEYAKKVNIDIRDTEGKLYK